MAFNTLRDLTGQKETKEEKPASTGEQLDELKGELPKKPGLFQLATKLIDDIKKLKNNPNKEEKKEQLKALALSALSLVILLGAKDKKKRADAAKKTAKKAVDKAKGAVAKGKAAVEAVTDDEEGEEVEETSTEALDARKKRAKVVCSNKRVCGIINTDPAGGMVPAICHKNPTYLLEYGLPEYEVFREEMVILLVPDAASTEDGLPKAVAALLLSPMGKFQCMPRDLFGFVGLPTKGDPEEILKGMWEFLQDEEIQRNACRGYCKALKNILQGENPEQFKENPNGYVAAGYYGGPSAGRAKMAADAERARLQRIEKGTATEADKKGPIATKAQMKRVKKEQGGGTYETIDSYASKIKKRPNFNLEAVVTEIGNTESYSYKGKTKPRDEAWERDQRYAYNREAETDQDTRIA